MVVSFAIRFTIATERLLHRKLPAATPLIIASGGIQGVGGKNKRFGAQSPVFVSYAPLSRLVISVQAPGLSFLSCEMGLLY